MQARVQLLPRHAALEQHLQESAASRSANHAPVNQVVNRKKNLVDAGVGAARVNRLGKLPVAIQQLREVITVIR